MQNLNVIHFLVISIAALLACSSRPTPHNLYWKRIRGRQQHTPLADQLRDVAIDVVLATVEGWSAMGF